MTIETTTRQVIAYPPFRRRSITEMLPVGVDRAGQEIGPRLREGGGYIWGMIASGTTTVRSVLTAGVVQCTDALVWTGDVNNLPDLCAFGPAIDWAADTAEDVTAMADAALRIALERKKASYELKMAINSNDMPVGDGRDGQAPPAIVLMLTADAARHIDFQLTMIRNLVRDAAIIPVIEGKQILPEYGSVQLRASMPNRIAMRVNDKNELAHGFSRYDLEPAGVSQRGDGFIATDPFSDTVVPFQGMLILPRQCREIAEQAAGIRPVLEEHSQVLAGEAYFNRK